MAAGPVGSLEQIQNVLLGIIRKQLQHAFGDDGLPIGALDILEGHLDGLVGLDISVLIGDGDLRTVNVVDLVQLFCLIWLE